MSFPNFVYHMEHYIIMKSNPSSTQLRRTSFRLASDLLTILGGGEGFQSHLLFLRFILSDTFEDKTESQWG